jgi:SWI/SNF-related matrix-associated actin-dependent regulator 1 of chromatin subfamily A
VVASKLATPEAAARIQEDNAKKYQLRQEAIVASRSAGADADLPRPDGLDYLPYQKAGIVAALARQNVLFGDEMGLGKTIQAIGMINTDETLRKILVVCPASLKLNWEREMRKWLVRQYRIAHASGSWCQPSVTDILIINYDVLSRHAKILRETAWDMIICDEAHYLKNPEAKRTQAICGKAKRKNSDEPGIEPIKARRAAFLTGTPIPNRPIEGFSLFNFLAPAEFRNKFSYGTRYCAAYQGQHGWDFSGSSNLGELQDRLRATIMIRRLKADVLKELPAKRRQVIEFEPSGDAARAIDREQEYWEEYENNITTLQIAVELAKASADKKDYEEAVLKLREATQIAFAAMAKVRHDTAVSKIPDIIEHVRDAMEGGKKVILFAHHKDVIRAVSQEFGDSAVELYGDTPMATRQANVDRFQTDPTCTLFVGGIQAAGVGITLTASDHVIFAELDWVPGNVTQAEDRAHRIGQHNNVLVQHLVLAGSLDAKMARTLVEKQEVIGAALDDETAKIPATPSKEKAASEGTSLEKLAKESEAMTPERIAAIHRGLQMLAGMCDGARELDGAGYSKLDAGIGHSLANAASLSPRQAALGYKLVNRYRRQLPEGLVQVAKGGK